jgi:hypothetical protein
VLHRDPAGRRKRQVGGPGFGGQQATAFGGSHQGLLDLCLVQDAAGDQRVQAEAGVK